MDPPVPIPNTVVKHPQAEGTWGAAPWEIRLLPVQFISGCHFDNLILLFLIV